MLDFLKRTWAEVNLDSLKHNIDICQGYLSENTEFVAVVKANAYGHCDHIVAPFIEKMGIKWFAVSNIKEAVRLREIGIKGSILIMGYTPPSEVDTLIKYNIVQGVTDYNHAKELSKSISQLSEDKKLLVHIKVDTGMSRIGIKAATIAEYGDEIEKISKLNGIEAQGMYTHLCVADTDKSDDENFTKMQIGKFLEIKSEVESRGISLTHAHYLNSAGASYLGDDQSTLARFGITIYGLLPNFEYPMPKPLIPVMELKSTIAYIKNVKKGETIGYGRSFTAQKDMKIATVTIGYADGYPRLLSNRGKVLVGGEFSNVVGRVCMDQMMIDVTDIKSVNVGDVVTIFGKDGDKEITADELAALYGTIGYELVCAVGIRVPRVIVKDGEIIDVVKYI